jgi:preprotein translocase subunit SecG
MQTILTLIHVLCAVFIIGLVLLQQGKGAEMGAAFGSGASNTLFGSAGTVSFLMRLTILFAAIFFATSLGLNYFMVKQVQQQNQLSLPQDVQHMQPKNPFIEIPIVPVSGSKETTN